LGMNSALTATKTRKAALEKQMTALAGVVVEITVRDLKEFTMSFAGKNDAAARKLRDFFKAQVRNVEIEYDFDCAETYVYISV